jgi:hypothetical protein
MVNALTKFRQHSRDRKVDDMKNAVGQKVLDLIMLGAASRKPNVQNQDGRESGRSQSQKTGAKS